jgi:hypothetical protein
MHDAAMNLVVDGVGGAIAARARSLDITLDGTPPSRTFSEGSVEGGRSTHSSQSGCMEIFCDRRDGDDPRRPLSLDFFVHPACGTPPDACVFDTGVPAPADAPCPFRPPGTASAHSSTSIVEPLAGTNRCSTGPDDLGGGKAARSLSGGNAVFVAVVAGATIASVSLDVCQIREMVEMGPREC